MMQKQILLATDFSPCSESALTWAAEWSRKAGARVHVFHKVVGAPNDWSSASIDAIDLSPEQKESITWNVRRIKNRLQGLSVPCEFIFSGRGISGFIDQYVRENGIDYVFMGSHGKVDNTSGEMGSNAMKTLMAVSVPVLVAKETEVPFDLDNFVFASDFDEEAKVAFRQILDFVSPFKPEIHFLNIEIPRFLTGGTRFILLDAIEDFKKIASEYKSDTHFHKDRKVGPGIIDYCKRAGVDLIAFSQSGKTLFGGSRFARPVEYLVRNAVQPILFVDTTQLSQDQ